MIYYNHEPLKVWQPNMIQLDLQEDLGHIYVTRNTYDQSVIIKDRFNSDMESVLNKLDLPDNQADVVEYLYNILPDPINILCPFYNLIDRKVEMDIDNIKQLVGVLSYISLHIDFNMLLKTPKEVRAGLTYTKSILLDYQSHFEDFNFKIISMERHIQESNTVESKEVKVNSNKTVSNEEIEELKNVKDDIDDEDLIINEEIDPAEFMAGLWDDLDKELEEKKAKMSQPPNTQKEELKEEVKEETPELSEKEKEKKAYDDIINSFL